MARNKKLLNRVTIIFISTVCLLIFFSNTIYNFNLPNVTLGFPADNDFILYSVTGRGSVELSDKQAYFADIPGIVETSIKPGDIRNEGQLLYRIIPQYEDISSELERLNNELTGLEYRIEKTNMDIAYYNQKIADAKIEETYIAPLDLSVYDAQLDSLSLKLDNLTSELAVSSTLYEIGAATKSQIEEKEKEKQNLELQYYQILHQKENAIDAYEKNKVSSAEAAQKQLDQQLDSHNKTIFDLTYQLKALYIEKDNLTIKINDIYNPDSEAFKEYAEEGCVIDSIFIESGAYVRKYDKILSAGLIDKEFIINMKMSDDVDYLIPDMMVDVNVRSKNIYNIPGQIQTVKYEDGVLYVKVRIPAVTNPPIESLKDLLLGVQLTGGEAADMTVEHNSGYMRYTVPNTAIHRDTTGYYVYEVIRTSGALGKNYIAHKKYVEVIMNSDRFSALNYVGVTFENPLIFNSDRVINDGDRVNPTDGADYIETR